MRLKVTEFTVDFANHVSLNDLCQVSETESESKA